MFETYLDKEYEIECPSGKYRLKPEKVWVVYSIIAGYRKRINVLALFRCPDDYPVTKRIDSFDVKE